MSKFKILYEELITLYERRKTKEEQLRIDDFIKHLLKNTVFKRYIDNKLPSNGWKNNGGTLELYLDNGDKRKSMNRQDAKEWMKKLLQLEKDLKVELKTYGAKFVQSAYYKLFKDEPEYAGFEITFE